MQGMGVVMMLAVGAPILKRCSFSWLRLSPRRTHTPHPAPCTLHPAPPHVPHTPRRPQVRGGAEAGRARAACDRRQQARVCGPGGASPHDHRDPPADRRLPQGLLGDCAARPGQVRGAGGGALGVGPVWAWWRSFVASLGITGAHPGMAARPKPSTPHPPPHLPPHPAPTCPPPFYHLHHSPSAAASSTTTSSSCSSAACPRSTSTTCGPTQSTPVSTAVVVGAPGALAAPGGGWAGGWGWGGGLGWAGWGGAAVWSRGTAVALEGAIVGGGLGGQAAAHLDRHRSPSSPRPAAPRPAPPRPALQASPPPRRWCSGSGSWCGGWTARTWRCWCSL